MNDVTTPMGRIIGDTMFTAIKSEKTSKKAPISPAAGTTYVLSPPILIRAIWGATSPTKPMVPGKTDD